MERGFLICLIFLSAFAGIGALHVLEMTGVVKVSLAIAPSDWVDTSSGGKRK